MTALGTPKLSAVNAFFWASTGALRYARSILPDAIVSPPSLSTTTATAIDISRAAPTAAAASATAVS